MILQAGKKSLTGINLQTCISTESNLSQRNAKIEKELTRSGRSGEDPKHSSDRRSCLPARPRLAPGEEGNSRRGTRRLSLVQGLSHLTGRTSGPSGSDAFVSSATLTFFLLWARPVSLWTHRKFLTSAASRSIKFTSYVCVRRGSQTKRTKTFCFKPISFITASSFLLEEARSTWLPFSLSMSLLIIQSSVISCKWESDFHL